MAGAGDRASITSLPCPCSVIPTQRCSTTSWTLLCGGRSDGLHRRRPGDPDRHDPRRFVEDLLERFRDLIVVRAVPEGAASVLRGVPEDQLNRMRTQANQLGAGELSRAADVTNTALTEMTGATSPRLHLELLCARLLLPAADESATGTLARVDRIERRLEYAGGAAPLTAPAQGEAPSRSAAPAQTAQAQTQAQAQAQTNGLAREAAGERASRPAAAPSAAPCPRFPQPRAPLRFQPQRLPQPPHEKQLLLVPQHGKPRSLKLQRPRRRPKHCHRRFQAPRSAARRCRHLLRTGAAAGALTPRRRHRTSLQLSGPLWPCRNQLGPNPSALSLPRPCCPA
jgi:hypothetical protein